jgi:hypothetical protein
MVQQERHACRRCGSTLRLHSIQDVLGKDKKAYSVRVYECVCGRLYAEEAENLPGGKNSEDA